MSVATPPVVVQPFGDTAGVGFITLPIPETAPVDPARASFEQGFPPITFQPVVGGGLPPDGRDFNGILYTVTAHCAYIQAGQPYAYNAAVPAQSTGYGMGAVLGMSDGTGLWFSLTANNAVNPDTTNTGWVPSYSYGFGIITGLTGGTLTLSVAQHRRNTIVLGGVLTSNLQVVFPNTLREWRVVNQCTGAFTVTAKTAAGTGVVVPSGSFSSPVSVYGDGTNLYPVVSPLVLPLSVAPVADTIVQRDASGFSYHVYLNQSSGLEAPTIGAVFVQNSAADGFLRKITVANFAAQINVGSFVGTVTNGQVPQAAVTQHAAALFASPTLTGVPVAPTAAAGTSDTQIATTAYANPGQSQGTNGFVRLPGGLLIQWGRVTYGNLVPGVYANQIAVTFPTAFTTVYTVIPSKQGDGTTAVAGARSVSTVGFLSYMEEFGAQTQGADNALTWIAIGV